MLGVQIIEEKVPIVIVEGNVQEANKNVINEAIRSVITPNNNQLILDVTGVTSLDGEEAQAIIEATHRALGSGGRLALVLSEKDKAHALREARVADTPGVFIFSNREEAMRYFGERGLGITA